MKELTKRILTSLLLSSFLILAFFYSFILVISLILISVITWIEFNGLISKIFINNYLLKLLFRASCLLYIFLFSVLIYKGIFQEAPSFKINIAFLFSICICSDIGGFFFGKTFKGKKLTKISPNKTISGSIGSFIMSLILAPIFYQIFTEKFQNIYELIIIAVVVSFFCQFGDLLFSYLKRKAKVKDTGDILPGHGGILDRIDGIIVAVPIGMILWEILLKI